MYPEMKYHGMKDLFRIVAIPLFAWAVWAAVVCCLRWQKFDGGTRIFMLVSLCIPIAGLCYVFSRLRHPSCYAELRADGLHVFSKESGELAFIDWNDVTDYRLVRNDIDAPHITYDLLIFRRGPGGLAALDLPRAAFLLGGGIISGLPMLLYSIGVKQLRLMTASIGQYISPTLGLLCSLILHEEITREKLVSLAFIWVGILIYAGFTLRDLKKQPV